MKLTRLDKKYQVVGRELPEEEKLTTWASCTMCETDDLPVRQLLKWDSRFLGNPLTDPIYLWRSCRKAVELGDKTKDCFIAKLAELVTTDGRETPDGGPHIFCLGGCCKQDLEAPHGL